MHNRILLCLAVWFIPVSLNGQSPSRNQVQEYIAQSKHFLKKREKDSAFLYVNKALAVSIKEKNVDQQVASLDQTGKIHLIFREYSEAVVLFEKALRLPASKKNCEIYNNLGIAKFNLGKGYESIKACLLAEECYKENKTEGKINSTLFMLGYSYMYVGEYEKASYYLLRQLNKIKTDTSQAVNVAKVYTALGNNSSLRGNYKESLKYLNEGLRIAHSKNDAETAIGILISLSSNYVLMKDYGKALQYSSDALSQSIQNNNAGAVLESKIYYTRALIGLKKYKQASLMLTEVEKDTVQPYFVPTLRIQYYTNSALTNEGLGQYKKALQQQKRLKQYNDSLSTANSTLGISDLKEQYELERNSNVILVQKTKLAQQAIQLKSNTILILVISFLRLF